MSTRFERFMVLRYLRSARGGRGTSRFIRFITGVAVGGVALGTAALLLALSIVRGFSGEIEAKITGFGAHVQVETWRDEPIDGAPRIEAELTEVEGVVEVLPVVEEFALIQPASTERSRYIEGAAIRGVHRPPAYIFEHIVSGQFDTSADSTGHPGLVIGRDLAELLGTEPGETVTVLSMRSDAGSVGNSEVGFDEASGIGSAKALGDDSAEAFGMDSAGILGGLAPPIRKTFHIAGVYETSLSNFDELYAFTSLPAAREVLGYGANQVTRFDLTLSQVEQARETAHVIEDRLRFPIMARSIYDVYSGLFAWVDLQESIIPIVISVIVIVAAFNIVGTLLMTILEKTREIGVLQSMGASRRSLHKLYVWLGSSIGLVGMAIGEALALGLGLLQARTGVIPLPEEAYYMETAPIELHLVDFAFVGTLAVGLCMLAAYVPARVAARIEPIRAIRFR